VRDHDLALRRIQALAAEIRAHEQNVEAALASTRRPVEERRHRDPRRGLARP